MEAVKNVMLVMKLLKSLGLKIKHPISIRVDNVGAILMLNITTTSCAKHVNIGYKYINENDEDTIMNNIFIKSKDNDSNMMMKNLHT